MNLKLATTLVVVASACLATASTAGAAGAGAVCPTFKQGRLTFHPETLGTGWTCSSAKPWIVKLIADPVHVGSRNVPLTNGPRGYHCLATPFRQGGHATSGACFKGTIAFPGSGFAWVTG
jgi:hypothetical protein